MRFDHVTSRFLPLILVQLVTFCTVTCQSYHIHGFFDRPWIGYYDDASNINTMCMDIKPIEGANRHQRPKIHKLEYLPVGHFRYDCEAFLRPANTSIKIFWGTGINRIESIVTFKDASCPTPHNEGHTLGNMSLIDRVAQVFHQNKHGDFYDCFRNEGNASGWDEDWKSMRGFHTMAWDTDEWFESL